MKRDSTSSPTPNSSKRRPRFLGYGLPRAQRDDEVRAIDIGGIDLVDVPLGADHSFLDFDGIVLMAGAFDELIDDQFSLRDPYMQCRNPADLHRRERELTTALENRKTIIFLVPDLPEKIAYRTVNPSCDLFRSFIRLFNVRWRRLEDPFPMVKSVVPEFRDFVSRHGTGYLIFGYQNNKDNWIKPICEGGDNIFGLVIGDRVFILPATVPQSHDQVVDMCRLAVPAALTYRTRVSEELPGWAGAFQFTQEADLRRQMDDVRTKLVSLEAEADRFGAFKGALVYQSDPLVEVVSRILREFFDIELTIDEKYIEDATIRDESSEILAVVEIKGVNGNFGRANVNQIDSHRERLSLPASTPGVLIMNTIRSAASLAEKDQAAHPDIIKKAVADNVLLLRTLDLLRYADAVQQGILPKDGLRATMLKESGWLFVDDQKAIVVKQ